MGNAEGVRVVAGGPAGVIGRYRLLERLGGGGMGVVFRAEDPLLGRDVAIKVARSAGARERDMFLSEARHAARIVHPNLVAVFDLGVHEETGFIAMELVHGTPLSQLIRRGPSDWSLAAAIGVGVAAGLAALHEALLVHRDIKPPNLMLGATGVMKIVDFGIATREDGDGNDPFGGTPGYIAPELILGERPRRSADVFALGVVLHELVMGRRLFEGESALARAIAVTQGAAPRLPSARAPVWFQDLVAACLDPDPEQRPKTAAEVLAVLRAREPYGDLGALAAELAHSSLATLSIDGPGLEDATALVAGSAPLIGRDALLARWHGKRGKTGWLVGRAGAGKTRLLSELALRCDVGAVLLVADASGLEPLALALGIGSGRDEGAVREALRELGPVFVALDDVAGEPDVVRRLVELVRSEVPDALLVLASERPPEGGLDAAIEVVELAPLGPGESEQLLATRLRSGGWPLARSLAPLGRGHPLSLELLALAIERADQSLERIAQGDLVEALVERVLATLKVEQRRVAELLAVATDRGATLLGQRSGVLIEETLERLGACGLLERREHGPTLHPAVRAAMLISLTRADLLETRRAELADVLAAVVGQLAIDARGPAPEQALRLLLLLRPELIADAERALRAPTLPRLKRLVPLLAATLDPTVQRFDAALPVLDGILEALHALTEDDDAIAHAYLARSWSRDYDVVAAMRDVEECIRRAPSSPRVLAEAYVALGSLLRRQGASQERVAAAHAHVVRIATFPDLVELAELGRWGILLTRARTGDHASCRAALEEATTHAPLRGTAAARVSLLRALIAMEVGDVPRAILESEATVHRGRALGQTHLVASALGYLVEVRIRQGELGLAESAARQAMLLARAAHAPLPHGFAAQAFSMIALMRGEWGRARRYAEEGLALVERGGSAGPRARGHALVAACLAVSGEEGAVARAEHALTIIEGLPPNFSDNVRMYAAFVRGVAGEAEAWAELDALVAAIQRSPHPPSEPAFAAAVLTAARALVPVARLTLPGPHAS